MALEQAGEGQSEVKSYDEQMADDVRAAFTEVTSKAAPEPVDDAPAPAERTEEVRTAAERARDEQGRFAKTDDKPVTAKPDKEVVQDKPGSVDNKLAPVSDKTQPALTPEQLSAQAAKTAMPTGLSVKAVSQWERLPQVAREEIARLATAAAPSDLAPFLDQAKKNGQSLAQALHSYTGMEALIKRDPAGGMMHVAQNLGLTQHQAGQLFADLATRLGVMPNHAGQQAASEGHDAQQEPDPYRALAPVLNPFQERLSTLETVIRQQQEALQGQRQSTAMSAVEKFRSSPEAKYFANVEQDIANLFDRGMVRRTGDHLADLKAAYDTACRLHPEISEILITERAEASRVKAEADARQAADKARQASRSVTGSPSSISMSTARKANGKSYDDDLHNDVLDAVRQVTGRA